MANDFNMINDFYLKLESLIGRLGIYFIWLGCLKRVDQQQFFFEMVTIF